MTTLTLTRKTPTAPTTAPTVKSVTPKAAAKLLTAPTAAALKAGKNGETLTVEQAKGITDALEATTLAKLVKAALEAFKRIEAADSHISSWEAKRDAQRVYMARTIAQMSAIPSTHPARGPIAARGRIGITNAAELLSLAPATITPIVKAAHVFLTEELAILGDPTERELEIVQSFYSKLAATKREQNADKAPRVKDVNADGSTDDDGDAPTGDAPAMAELTNATFGPALVDSIHATLALIVKAQGLNVELKAKDASKVEAAMADLAAALEMLTA